MDTQYELTQPKSDEPKLNVEPMTPEKTGDIPTPSNLVDDIKRCQQAYHNWQSEEIKRLEALMTAKAAGLPADSIEELSKPIPKPEEAKRGEKLEALSSDAKKACEDAYVRGNKKGLDALIKSITEEPSATPERIIQAATVAKYLIEGRNFELAEVVLGKNPDALYLEDIEDALRNVVLEQTKSVDDLLRVAHTKQEDPSNPDKLLKLATSETSPLKKDLRDQLQDLLYLIRGARAQQLVTFINNKLAEKGQTIVSLTNTNMKLLSEITGIQLNLTDLQNALAQYRKLLYERGIVSSNYAGDLSKANFGEALAALSQITKDPIQQRILTALAIGYASGVSTNHGTNKYDDEKAENIVMALLLDRNNPEVSVLRNTIEEYRRRVGRREGNILDRQILMVFDNLMYNEKDIFLRQNINALNFQHRREEAEKAKAEAEKKAREEAEAKNTNNS